MTYELINQKTTNTFGHYDSERAAAEAYERVHEADPQLAEELIVVKFDDNGEAVESHTPQELFAI